MKREISRKGSHPASNLRQKWSTLERQGSLANLGFQLTVQEGELPPQAPKTLTSLVMMLGKAIASLPHRLPPTQDGHTHQTVKVNTQVCFDHATALNYRAITFKSAGIAAAQSTTREHPAVKTERGFPPVHFKISHSSINP